MEKLLERFEHAARELRAAVRSDEPDLLEWTRRVRNGVAGAYLAAAFLPQGEITGDAEPPDRHPSTADESALAARLAGRLGSSDVISQGLAEIDSDLAEALSWISEPHDNLLWDLRFAFEEHWGKHALDVLRPLHLLASGRIG